MKHSKNNKRFATTTIAALSAVAALSLLAANAAAAPADDLSPWLVRVRAVNLDMANKSTPIGGVGASDRLTIGSKTIPEIDFSYFFTPHISTELVLTYPQKKTVYLDGAKIGTFKHVPPTLLAQYHFLPDAQVNPYVGLGVNYTNMHKVHLLDGNAGLEHSSWGLAAQIGFDVKIDKNWSLNFDAKKVRIRSDVNSGGAIISKVKVDPVMLGVGVGYRF